MSETRKRTTPPYQGSQQRLRFRQRRAFPFFRFSVFPLPVIRIFYANRKQGNRPVFRFVFQHHCSNNRQTALFKCRLKPHPHQRVCLINRCFSRFQSASFILWRLSCCFLPFAKPISILIFPREKCRFSGTIV